MNGEISPGPQIISEIFGFPITDTLIASWIVIGVVAIASYMVTRKLKMRPGVIQNGAELLIEFIEEQIDPLLPGRGREFLPFIGTLFIYVGVSNVIGFIPGASNPTADINTTLGLGLTVFAVSHYYGIKSNGLVKYVKGFAEPMVFLLPLNIISELAKPISHSFRLFGNILGGGIILAILYQFVPWVVPVPLHAWFDLFVGVIQALVFGMLAIAYISSAED